MKIEFLSYCAFGIVAASLPTQLLYQFSAPPWAGIENIAIRPNGRLLLSLASGPYVYQFDPAAKTAELLVTIPYSPEAVFGIAQPSPDIFVIAAGNLTIGPQIPGGATGTIGTFCIWMLNLTAEPVVQLLTAIPEANTLNGATTIPGLDNVVLYADSGLGAVWSVDIRNGSYEIAFSDTLFAPNAQQSLGINGIHVQGNHLYFTNSAQGVFGKVGIAIEAGKVVTTEAAQIIALGPANTTSFFDDFALDARETAWIATHPNAMTSVTSSGTASIAAGGGNDTSLLGPTSAVFDTDGCRLYIVTAGNIDPLQGGQILVLDTCDKWQ